MWPTSIRGINDLPEPEKIAIYRMLLPEWLFAQYGIDYETMTYEGQPVVRIRCPKGHTPSKSPSSAEQLILIRCSI
jgi:hypothetical protein